MWINQSHNLSTFFFFAIRNFIKKKKKQLNIIYITLVLSSEARTIHEPDTDIILRK